MKIKKAILALMVLTAFGVGMLSGEMKKILGNIESPAGPTESSAQMFTLDQIYDRIDDGSPATKMNTFTDPASGPDETGVTLNEIYELTGQRAHVTKTGQTTCYDAAGAIISCVGTSQDGDLQKGVTWPIPRFTDNNDGTVTDNLTGLIWLKDAGCSESMTWTNALSWASGLYDGCISCGTGGTDCGLSDGSVAGDWRLPNVRELLSLIDFSKSGEMLASGHPFINIAGGHYWTSTTMKKDTEQAWSIRMGYEVLLHSLKTITANVWAVRGGQ